MKLDFSGLTQPTQEYRGQVGQPISMPFPESPKLSPVVAAGDKTTFSEAGTSICPPRSPEHPPLRGTPEPNVEIEQAFLTWTSPIQITENYGVSRDSVYRHAHALSLFDKRSRNVRSALERIIEKAGDVEVTAAAVVSAIAAYAKINANGQWVERSETVNLNELFDRMTSKEMDHYAKQGTLPAWFEHILGATGSDSRGGPNDC